MTSTTTWYAEKYPQIRFVSAVFDVDSTNVLTAVDFKDGLWTEGEGKTLEASVADAVASHTGMNK